MPSTDSTEDLLKSHQNRKWNIVFFNVDNLQLLVSQFCHLRCFLITNGPKSLISVWYCPSYSIQSRDSFWRGKTNYREWHRPASFLCSTSHPAKGNASWAWREGSDKVNIWVKYLLPAPPSPHPSSANFPFHGLESMSSDIYWGMSDDMQMSQKSEVSKFTNS